MAEICLIKVGGVHYIHRLLRLPHSIRMTGGVEEVETTLVIVLICMRFTVRWTVTDQQDKSVALEGKEKTLRAAARCI